MTLYELNFDQRLQVKQHMLCERAEQPSWGELANADELVTDAEMEERYGGTEFVEDDFQK